MRCATVTALLTLILARSTAAGQGEPAAEGSAERARGCFQRGVELYDEHDLDGAEVEFHRAYDLAKNFRILYNLGQIAQERHDYAAAQDLFYRYLRDGGPQVASDRVQMVEGELAKLRQRVGRLSIVYDGPEAEVLVDQVVVGRTPLRTPLTVNLGRRRVDLKPRQGENQVRFVDIAGGDTVALHVTVETDDGEDPFDEALPARTVDAHAPASPPVGHTSGSVGLAWTFTGVMAASTVVAGVVAYRASKDLQDARQTYPVTGDELDNKRHTARVAGWVTDGLLAGTAVLATVSLYLTIGRPTEDKPVSRLSVGWSWPGVVRLSSTF